MSTTYSAIIGTDTSIDLTAYNAPSTAAVRVVARHGDVEIDGPFEGWMGFRTLARFDDPIDAMELARRIAANPARELDALGYDYHNWLAPLA